MATDKQARIIALANQKGGVGKTTTAVNLGAALAAGGARVLLVDLDPQGNATSHLGYDKRTLKRSVYDLLVNQVELDQVTLITRRPRLDLVPAAPALAGAEIEMVGMLAREHLLGRALDGARAQYDYILIDPPPSLGLLTVNALTAADLVLIPVQTEYMALEGLSQLVNTIELVRDRLNPRLRIGGLLLTMYDVRTNLAAEVADEVRRHFPGLVFNTVIPRNIRLSEAPSYGETIYEYDPRSAGAVAYARMAEEFKRRLAGTNTGGGNS